MEYSIVVIMVALIQYQLFGLRTGVARPKFGILPPKTVGNETWERIYRVHQNTLEQIVVFIPGMIGFTYYVSEKWAVALGILFIIFRQIYSVMYLKDPKRRMFPPSFFVNMILIVGTMISAVVHLIRG